VLLLKSISPAARTFLATLTLAFLLPASLLHAATGGSISGAITDRSGAIVIDATLKLVNTAQQTTYQ
jgi:hypothetical protein